jgi:Mn-dependent DtxR family transcriptional regulator
MELSPSSARTALNKLLRLGHVENIAYGTWSITETGRIVLQEWHGQRSDEKDIWSGTIPPYQFGAL